MDDDMEVDGKLADTEEDVETLKQDVKEYLKEGHLKPQAPDAQTYLDTPFEYNPGSTCLNGTIDGENNTALIVAVKAGADR